MRKSFSHFTALHCFQCYDPIKWTGTRENAKENLHFTYCTWFHEGECPSEMRNAEVAQNMQETWSEMPRHAKTNSALRSFLLGFIRGNALVKCQTWNWLNQFRTAAVKCREIRKEIPHFSYFCWVFLWEMPQWNAKCGIAPEHPDRMKWAKNEAPEWKNLNNDDSKMGLQYWTPPK